MSLFIKKDLCTGCGLCVKDCVCGILELHDSIAFFPEQKAGICVHCGHCAAICPTEALVLDEHLLENTSQVYNSVEPKDMLDYLLKGRRSMRQFTGAEVDKNALISALDYANYAPTAHNSREVSYLVINGREKVETLLQSTAAHMKKHAMFLGHVANVENGKDTLFRGAPCLILVHAPERILSETDCATAISYLEVSLHGLGLGSCWAGMLLESCAFGLPEGLSVPEGHKLYGALMVGHHTVSYAKLPFRTAPRVEWS